MSPRSRSVAAVVAFAALTVVVGACSSSTTTSGTGTSGPPTTAGTTAAGSASTTPAVATPEQGGASGSAVSDAALQNFVGTWVVPCATDPTGTSFASRSVTITKPSTNVLAVAETITSTGAQDCSGTPNVTTKLSFTLPIKVSGSVGGTIMFAGLLQGAAQCTSNLAVECSAATQYLADESPYGVGIASNKLVFAAPASGMAANGLVNAFDSAIAFTKQG